MCVAAVVFVVEGKERGADTEEKVPQSRSILCSAGLAGWLWTPVSRLILGEALEPLSPSTSSAAVGRGDYFDVPGGWRRVSQVP